MTAPRSVPLRAAIAVYRLRQPSLGEAIEVVCRALRARGLEPDTGAMSTTVQGSSLEVFEALRDGFERAAAAGDLVMTVTFSNACPQSDVERRSR